MGLECADHLLGVNQMDELAVAVVGSRTFTDYALLARTLDALRGTVKIRELISGGAKGADTLAERWARENKVPIRVFRPDWSLGRCAGLMRNKDIVKEADYVLAFWNGTSRGTSNSISLARTMQRQLRIINYEDPVVVPSRKKPAKAPAKPKANRR